MQEIRRSRVDKKKSGYFGLIISGLVAVILVTGLYWLWQQQSNHHVASNQEKSTQQSSVMTNGQQATPQQEVTQQTTQVTNTQKYELVIENGIAKVGDVIIVNKRYGLPKEYNPGVNKEAEAQFFKLKEKMQALGYNVGNEYSGFRSYELQEYFYNSYVQQVGKAEADKELARPGHSEHQTGLAFDFKDEEGGLLAEYKANEAADWLEKHAHEYGFIVRYLPGTEAITGYSAEPWHIRYLGDLAKEVYASGLTLEEFFGIEGGGYQN